MINLNINTIYIDINMIRVAHGRMDGRRDGGMDGLMVVRTVRRRRGREKRIKDKDLMDMRMDRETDGWTEAREDGRTDEWTEGQRDGGIWLSNFLAANRLNRTKQKSHFCRRVQS